jgi:hypothetical protein
MDLTPPLTTYGELQQLFDIISIDEDPFEGGHDDLSLILSRINAKERNYPTNSGLYKWTIQRNDFVADDGYSSFTIYATCEDEVRVYAAKQDIEFYDLWLSEESSKCTQVNGKRKQSG